MQWLLGVGALVAATPVAESPCDSTSAVILVAHDDPSYSQVGLRRRDGVTLLRATGDMVQGYRVETIHWDRVVLARGESRCELRLGEAPAGPAPQPPPAAGTRDALPDWLGVQHLGPGEIAIERGSIDRLIEEAATLGRGVRGALTPDGLRLARVRGPLAALGFQKGDVLHDINGVSLGDPRALLEMVYKIRFADRVVLRFSRGTSRGTLAVEIR